MHYIRKTKIDFKTIPKQSLNQHKGFKAQNALNTMQIAYWSSKTLQILYK